MEAMSMKLGLIVMWAWYNWYPRNGIKYLARVYFVVYVNPLLLIDQVHLNYLRSMIRFPFSSMLSNFLWHWSWSNPIKCLHNDRVFRVRPMINEQAIKLGQVCVLREVWCEWITLSLKSWDDAVRKNKRY